MRVLIDATVMSTPYRHGGIGRYLVQLLDGLEKTPKDDIEVTVMAAGDWSHTASRRFPSLAFQRYSNVGGSRAAAIAAQTFVPLASRRHDVLHSPALSYNPGLPTLSLWAPARQVAVVHDLIPLGMPEQYLGRPWRRACYRASLRRLRRCAAVLAVSGHTAEALRRGGYAISPRVVANSVPAFSGSAEADLVRSGPVMAFVGHGPSKNPRLLAEVAKRYYARTGERIAVVGQADLEGTVSLGRLADSELVDLYRSARALLVPSVFEGFCYPAVEARANGLPVVALMAEWSAWLFPDRENLLPDDADRWVDWLVERRSDDMPGRLRPELHQRSSVDVARETMTVWREVS